MPRLLVVDRARVVQQLKIRAMTRIASFTFHVTQSTEVRTYNKCETLLISLKKNPERGLNEATCEIKLASGAFLFF